MFIDFDYFYNVINNIKGVHNLKSIITGKNKQELSFTISCNLKVMHEYDEDDSFVYDCSDIDTRLEAIRILFGIKNRKITNAFNFADIDNYNNIESKPFKFTYINEFYNGNNYNITMKVKSYCKDNSSDNYFLHFYITIKKQ